MMQSPRLTNFGDTTIWSGSPFVAAAEHATGKSNLGAALPCAWLPQPAGEASRPLRRRRFFVAAGRFLFLAALALSARPAAGQEQHRQRLMQAIEAFELFHACQPVVLVIEPLGAPATRIQLTDESLHSAVEARLRSARLYAGTFRDSAFDIAGPGRVQPRGGEAAALGEVMKDWPPRLEIEVNILNRSFLIVVRLRKMAVDKFGALGSATTWETVAFGAHGGDAGYVRASLSESLDEFLVAYLRVNEDACGH